MNIRLLANLFIALTLLMGTLSCSSKEPVSPTPNTGSFQLDATALDCQAKATRSAGSIGSTMYDFLEVNLIPTSSMASVEHLNLLFYKIPGSSTSTYLLHNLQVYPKGNAAPYNFASTGFTLTVGSDGSFSGNFAGIVSASSSMIPGPYSTITNGVFTAVRP